MAEGGGASNVSFSQLEGGKKFSMTNIKDEKIAEYYKNLLQPGDVEGSNGEDFADGDIFHNSYGGGSGAGGRSAESINFHEPVSLAYKEHLAGRRKEPRYLIWFFVLGTGFCVACVTILMVSLLHGLQKGKYFFLRLGLLEFEADSTSAVAHTAERNYGLGYFMWILVSMICAITASMVGRFAPQTVGGGTPEVFSQLNGIDTPSMGNLKILAAKLIATIFSVGSGLPIGFYGPIIQAGTMISAALVARGKCWKWSFLQYFQNPRDERIITIVGAAVGVTGAFGVPLGGLMLVMEMLSTAFPLRVAFYVFVSCLSASFLIQVFFSYFRAFQLRDRAAVNLGDLFPGAMVQFDTRIDGTEIIPMNTFIFLPSILIGITGGLFGAGYIRLGSAVVSARKFLADKVRIPLLRALESSILAFLYATVVFWLTVSAFGTEIRTPSLLFSPGCTEVPLEFRVEEGTSTVNYYGLQDSVCQFDGTNKTVPVFHPFGSLAMGFPDSAAQMLLSWNTAEDIGVATTSTFFALYFVFSSLTTGARISGDILLPCIVMGGAAGRLIGLGTRAIAVKAADGVMSDVNWADPGVFALIGAGAFLAGTTRLTFSIAVILIELTNDFRHVAAVMVAISIAKAIGDKLSKSSAATYLELNDVPVLDFYEKVKRYDVFTAKDVMCSNVKSLNTVETISRLCLFLKQTTHNGFPVVSAEGTVKGLILKYQISLLLWRTFLKKDHSEATYDDLRETETILKDLNFNPKYQFPSFGIEWAEVRIDLNSHVDTSAFMVSERSVLSRTYNLFTTMGVRHLIVVNEHNKLAGIITRKDLMGSQMMLKILAENHRRRVAEGLEEPAAGVTNMPEPVPSDALASGGGMGGRYHTLDSTKAMRGSEYGSPLSRAENETRWTVDRNSFGSPPLTASMTTKSHHGLSPHGSPTRSQVPEMPISPQPTVDPLVASDGRRRPMLHRNAPGHAKVTTVGADEGNDGGDGSKPRSSGVDNSQDKMIEKNSKSVTGAGGVGVPRRGGGGKKELQKILDYRPVEHSDDEDDTSGQQ